MKADGKLAQSTFNGALDEVKKSLGGGSKKQWNPETISQAIDDAIKNERRITAELQEKFASAENSSIWTFSIYESLYPRKFSKPTEPR